MVSQISTGAGRSNVKPIGKLCPERIIRKEEEEKLK